MVTIPFPVPELLVPVFIADSEFLSQYVLILKKMQLENVGICPKFLILM